MLTEKCANAFFVFFLQTHKENENERDSKKNCKMEYSSFVCPGISYNNNNKASEKSCEKIKAQTYHFAFFDHWSYIR